MTEGHKTTVQQRTRKHLYLITEHEEEGRVGGVAVYDTRFSRGNKNDEIPITVPDEEIEGFAEVGKKVYLGYLEFDSQEEYEQHEDLAGLFQEKVSEVDREWAEKAGIEETIYDE